MGSGIGGGEIVGADLGVRVYARVGRLAGVIKGVSASAWLEQPAVMVATQRRRHNLIQVGGARRTRANGRGTCLT